MESNGHGFHATNIQKRFSWSETIHVDQFIGLIGNSQANPYISWGKAIKAMVSWWFWPPESSLMFVDVRSVDPWMSQWGLPAVCRLECWEHLMRYLVHRGLKPWFLQSTKGWKRCRKRALNNLKHPKKTNSGTLNCVFICECHWIYKGLQNRSPWEQTLRRKITGNDVWCAGFFCDDPSRRLRTASHQLEGLQASKIHEGCQCPHCQML